MITIATWNVNGIRSVAKRVDWVAFLANDYDVVCLQETKAEPDQLEESVRNPAGYYSYFSHPKKRKGYSGVAIMTKVEPQSVSYDFPADIAEKYHLCDDAYGDPNDEGRIITMEFQDFYLVNVYTPNSKGDLSRLELRQKFWDPAFLEHCERLQEEKPVVFCGDLNVAHTPDDLANPKSNARTHGFTDEERGGIDNMIESGFADAFRLFTTGNGHYTWWSPFAQSRDRNVGWRIDYFFVSSELVSNIRSCEIRSDILGSDHCPVVLALRDVSL
jgi:exodeoxyribonuclease III